MCSIIILLFCKISDLDNILSPAKPRVTSKFDNNSGARTVGHIGGIMPRRSTTLYEKTASTEKTNAPTDPT
jgi:hypothetical protein